MRHLAMYLMLLCLASVSGVSLVWIAHHYGEEAAHVHDDRELTQCRELLKAEGESLRLQTEQRWALEEMNPYPMCGEVRCSDWAPVILVRHRSKRAKGKRDTKRNHGHTSALGRLAGQGHDRQDAEQADGAGHRAAQVRD